MNPWQQKLDDTQIATKVHALDEKLASYDELALSVDDRSHLERIKAVIEQLRIIIENVAPEVVNLTAASTLTASLDNVNSYLDNWASTKDSTYLDNHIFNETNTIIQSIAALAPAVNLAEARAAITSLRRSAGQQKRIVENITKEIEIKGSLADTTIDEKLVEFNELIDTKVQSAKEKLVELDGEIKVATTQIDESKVAASKLSTEQNEAFNTAQTKRTEEFSDFVKEQENEAGGLLTSIANDAKTKVDTVKEKAEKSATLADEARVKSEKLLGIVSQNSLINDYSKNGLHEQKLSQRWQYTTLGLLIVTVSIGAVLAFYTNDDTSWQKIVARFGVLIATGSIAAYTASQSSEHKQAQRHSEHLSLQLSAVRPYLADVDDKKQRDSLLIKLAEKFFSEQKPKEIKSHRSKKKNTDENTINSEDLPGLIGAIINFMNTMNKK